MGYELTLRDLIKSIYTAEKDCKIDNSTDDVDYEKFYERVMGIIELADQVTRPSGGGMHS